MLKKYTQKANRHNFTACICLSVMDGDREKKGGEKEMRRGEKKKDRRRGQESRGEGERTATAGSAVIFNQLITSLCLLAALCYRKRCQHRVDASETLS